MSNPYCQEAILPNLTTLALPFLSVIIVPASSLRISPVAIRFVPRILALVPITDTKAPRSIAFPMSSQLQSTSLKFSLINIWKPLLTRKSVVSCKPSSSPS